MPEDPPIAPERRRSLLHPRAARLHERHDWDPGPFRRLEHSDDRVGVTLAERAAEIGAILRVARDRAPGHSARRSDYAIARLRAVAEPGRHDLCAQRLHTAGVAQRLEPLARTEATNLLRDRGGGHPSTPCSTSVTLCPPNANELEIATGGPPLAARSGRASPGT